MTPSQVRAIRQTLGLSRRELAARLGVSPVTVASWEQGERHPRPWAALRLADLAREHQAARLAEARRMVAEADSTEPLQPIKHHGIIRGVATPQDGHAETRPIPLSKNQG